MSATDAATAGSDHAGGQRSPAPLLPGSAPSRPGAYPSDSGREPARPAWEFATPAGRRHGRIGPRS